MNPILYAIKKHYYKNQENKLNLLLNNIEENHKRHYQSEHISNQKPKVCTYQTGYQRHFSRFYTSTIQDDFRYELTESPENADIIVFINTIDSEIIRVGQDVVLFFHEPKDYAHLYQTTIDSKLSSNRIQVISHLKSPSEFITNPENVIFHRSIPYVHFHHGATADQLQVIDGSSRSKTICSITSGFSGIPGYEFRRNFIQQLSEITPNFQLYGRFSKEAAALLPYNGPCNFKWETLKNYKYNLVIENSDDEYYISEKIFDSLICGCMPIYHGSEKIFELIPESWFYYIPKLDSQNAYRVAEIIRSDSYKRVSDHRAEISNEIYKNYSFYSALDKLIGKETLLTPR